MNERVPEDWSTIQIKDLGSFYGGLTGKTSKDFGDGEPFLTYMQVFSQKTLDKEAVNSVQITKEENQNKVIYGDILFTTSSETPDEIGMSEVFLGTDWSPYLNSFCFGLRLEKPSPIYPLFAKYLFRGRKFRHDIRPLAQGSTRFNLSKGYLGKLSLLIPPLPEQKKIAYILTSVDEVIEKTQLQINKLQDLKKGTMNELLTKGIGHTEFKDSELGRIPKSWEVKKLGYFCKHINKKNNEDNQIPVLSVTKYAGFVNSREYFKKQIFSKDLSTYKLVKKGQFAYATIHLDEGSLGLLKKHEFGLISPMYTVFETNDYINKDYLFMLMKSDIFMKKYQVIGQGSINRRMTISFDSLSQLTMPFPPLQEQNEITKITNQIDKNINFSLNKLSQTQSLKKSLMQDLLTGKVRVTEN